METNEISSAQAGIGQLQESLHAGVETCGYGIKEAGLRICQDWLAKLAVNAEADLVGDVDLLILRLDAFRTLARRILPIRNGGFGGHDKEVLLSALREAGCEIFPTEEGLYSYHACEDDFETSAEAIVSALQDHPEVVRALLHQDAGATAS